jgi:hypothetical protein
LKDTPTLIQDAPEFSVLNMFDDSADSVHNTVRDIRNEIMHEKQLNPNSTSDQDKVSYADYLDFYKNVIQENMKNQKNYYSSVHP